MNIQELQTVVGNNIDIKVFILNNKSYGNIVIGAKKEFNGRAHGNDASTGYTVPDFIKVATAYGIQTEIITNNEEVQDKIRCILKKDGPIIVDVRINPEQGHKELKI